MRAATTGVLWAMTLFVTPSSTLAQSVGDTLRVSLPEETVIGVLSAASERGFDIVQGGSTRSFTYDRVQLVERYDGMQGQTKKFAVYGGAAGAAVGAVGFGFFWERCGGQLLNSICSPPGIESALVMGVAMGVGGAIYGAVIGKFVFKREVWTTIPIPPQGTRLAPIVRYRTTRGRPAIEFGIQVGR